MDGSERQFSLFLNSLNDAALDLGIQFTGSCAPSLEFLDVKVDNSEAGLRTTLFIKPTDSPVYLNRRSFHSKHSFRSLPYSQFRRAVVICSNCTDRVDSINYMYGKFLTCGYSEVELYINKFKALSLCRETILEKSHNENIAASNNLTFVVPYNPINKDIRSFVVENKNDFTRLVGEKRLILAERRNPNTASLLFKKSSFSRCPKVFNDTQKCMNKHGPKCKTCPIISLPKSIVVNKAKIMLDFSLNCKSENVIYICICNFCGEVYVGQTQSSFQKRLNGHRSSFKLEIYDKSALSLHIYEHHVESFSDKLKNFKVGIIKQTMAKNLDKLEDFYISKMRAQVIGLNRIKVNRIF